MRRTEAELLQKRVSWSEIMNRLPFVRWDRCAGGPEYTVVYGWIDRDDEYKDFVLLEFYADLVGFSTSSAERSAEIHRLIYGTDAGHLDCERVEDVFGGLVDNAIHLDDRPDSAA